MKIQPRGVQWEAQAGSQRRTASNESRSQVFRSAKKRLKMQPTREISKIATETQTAAKIPQASRKKQRQHTQTFRKNGCREIRGLFSRSSSCEMSAAGKWQHINPSFSNGGVGAATDRSQLKNSGHQLKLEVTRAAHWKYPKARPKGSRNFPEKPIVDQKQKPPDLAESPQE